MHRQKSRFSRENRSEKSFTKVNYFSIIDVIGEAAKEGGAIAGDARRALEKKSGHKVVSKSNFLDTNPLEVELIPEK